MNLDPADAQIEEAVERGLAGLAGFAGLGLVGCAVLVDDQMELRAIDCQRAQKDARAHEIEYADAHAEDFNLRVGGLIGVFKSVQNYAAGIGLQGEEMPVKGANFSAAAGGCFQLFDQMAADHFFKAGRGGPE